MKFRKPPMNCYTGLNLGMIFGGFCLLFAGYFLGYNWLTAIGGTFFGASLGSYFGRKANQDILGNFALLDQPEKFTSEEEKIAHFRREWHYYHVTRIDGKYVWRHTIYDFSKTLVPGYLQAITKVKSPLDDEIRKHIVYAGVRRNKLIFLRTAIEGEEAGISIFPNVRDTFRLDYCGIIDMTTWDRNPSISPIVISANPKYGTEYTIEDSKAEELDQLWISTMRTYGFDILPRVNSFKETTK